MDSRDHWRESLFLAPVVDEQLDATLTRVSRLAVEQIRDCAMAGITLIRGGKPVTAAFTDREAPEIDTAQYESNSGPCLDAFRQNVVLSIEDTRLETRWPEFAATAAEHGILSTLSLPLCVNGAPMGALNLYSHTADAFVEDDTPGLFASHAAVALANAQAYWAAHELSTQLEIAMKSRAVIEQAKGVLMSRYGCDADEAFDLLKSESQSRNIKLRDLARATVEEAANRASEPEAAT